ncbi:MAG: carbohydrate binding protein, partial [Clostridia bacterium]|nr:carbohydrate binding protein [Clostridia bacterium]
METNIKRVKNLNRFNNIQDNAIIRNSLKGFIKSLKNDMKTIKNAYKLTQENGESSGVKEYLRDNYFLIHKAYVSVFMNLMSVNSLPFTEHNLPRIYEYSIDFCRLSNNIVQKDAIESYLEDIGKKIDLQNDEINLFVDMFKVALIKLMAELLKKDRKDIEFGNAISSLRFLSNYIYDDIYERVSKNEYLLKLDKWYNLMDKKSKDIYRHKISMIAIKEKKTEHEIIIEALNNSKGAAIGRQSHIGYYLFKAKKKTFYIPLTVILPVLFSVFIFLLTFNIFTALLVLLPAWEIIKVILDTVYSKLIKSHELPRIEFKESCPATLVTITTLISDMSSIDYVIKNLEEYYFSNKCLGVRFGFLADLPQAVTAVCPSDQGLVDYSRTRIKELNKKYGGAFFCCIRVRTLSKDNGMYMGKERKRGA